MQKNILIDPPEAKVKLFTTLISKDSLFLAFLSIMSFLISLAYEAGRLAYYDAPIIFIQINPVTVVIAFLLISVPILVMMGGFFQIITEIGSLKSLIGRAYMKSVLFAFPIFWAINIFFDFDEKVLLIYLGLSILFFIIHLVIALTFSFSSKRFNKEIFWGNMNTFDKFLSLNDKSINFQSITYLLLIFIFLCFVYGFGYRITSRETSYWVIDDEPNVFLVASYDNKAILSRWDNNTMYFTKCFEIRDISSIGLKLRREKLKSPLIKPKEKDENYAHCN